MVVEGITQFQEGLLKDTAQLEVQLFVMPKPLPSDSSWKAARLIRHWKEVERLKQMGLVEDISFMFPLPLAEQKKSTGREHVVYGLTQLAESMFQSSENRYIN